MFFFVIRSLSSLISCHGNWSWNAPQTNTHAHRHSDEIKVCVCSFGCGVLMLLLYLYTTYILGHNATPDPALEYVNWAELGKNTLFLHGHGSIPSMLAPNLLFKLQWKRKRKRRKHLGNVWMVNEWRIQSWTKSCTDSTSHRSRGILLSVQALQGRRREREQERNKNSNGEQQAWPMQALYNGGCCWRLCNAVLLSGCWCKQSGSVPLESQEPCALMQQLWAHALLS